MTAMLTGSDFLRAPIFAPARPGGFKEWHHFVVHGRGGRFLVNFSLTDQTTDAAHPRLVPRVIVIAHDGRWSGSVQPYPQSRLTISADLGDISIGGNRMTVGADGYHVTLDLPEQNVAGELEFTSDSKPFVVNNQPVGDGRMSWLFVPRLRVRGWLRTGDREHRFADDLAYHDHNWGRFRWGEDFGWTWGTVLPHSADVPWSMVFLQMTDRSRLQCLSQALYVWHRDEPAVIFRHAALSAHARGRLDAAADCTLPPAMRLLLDGEVPGVPELLAIDAERAGDTAHIEFRPRSYARLAQPSETDLRGCTVLCESIGTVAVAGRIGGTRMTFDGTGVFEFLHG